MNVKTNKLVKYIPKFLKNLHSDYFASVKPNLWFSDSLRIQHQDIYKDQLFVIDTDNYQIIQIFLKKNSYRKINLPIKHIFRGLAIPMKGKVLLTGFETQEKIAEDQTAIFEFSF